MCQIRLILVTLQHQDVGTLCQPHVVAEPAHKSHPVLYGPEALLALSFWPKPSGCWKVGQEAHRGIRPKEAKITHGAHLTFTSWATVLLEPKPGPSAPPGPPPAAAVHTWHALRGRLLTGHNPAGGGGCSSLQLGQSHSLPQGSCV